MKSELAQQTNMSRTLNALRKQGKMFGVGDALAEQIDDYLDDCETRVAYWANDTFNSMAKKNVGVPVDTGNLKDSLEMDSSQSPVKTFVGVDLNKLEQGEAYPGYDYTEEANTWNEQGFGHIKSEFINAVWFEQGKKHAKKYFGKIKTWKKD